MLLKRFAASIILSVSMSVIGVLLILGGELSEGSYLYTWRGVLQTLGGTSLGAGIAISITTLSSIALVKEINKLLEQSTEAIEVDEAGLIKNYQHKWYYYYKTQIKGKRFWRMVVLDLSHGFGNLRLLTRVHLMNQDREKEFYKVEVQARFRRIVISWYPEVRVLEPTMIAVFHLSDRQPYAGVKQLMTWDQTNLVSPTVLSKTPLAGWATEQQAMPDDVAKVLDGVWAQEISATVDSVLASRSENE